MTLIKNHRLISATLALMVVLGANSIYSPTVHANTVVGAVVCSPSNSASLAIAQPIDGHTVTDMPVTISGSLILLSQIRVFIDNVFTETVPVPADATTFSFDLILPTGSHEVRLEGVDICQLTSPVAQVVVVYNPDTTVVGQSSKPQTSQTPEVGHTPIDDQPSVFEWFASNNVISGVSNAGYGVLEALDIVNSKEAAQTTKMISRFTLVTAGSTLVMLAPWVLHTVTRVIARILPHQAALVLGRPRLFGPAWVRALGLALLAIGMM